VIGNWVLMVTDDVEEPSNSHNGMGCSK